MSLDWPHIRASKGTQQGGFEDLCAQLARLETPTDAKFVRKGTPDAGVECFSVLQNGDEWGWQAKFFTSPLGQPQWQQLDKSVKTALDRHPDLVRYYVCIPRDRPDGRSEGTTSELWRWNNRVATWQQWARERGMDVEFVWWGSAELVERLSEQTHAGRVEFWFGNQQRFSEDWFRSRLDEALATAGPRYTPEVHIDPQVARMLEIFGRTDSAFDSIRSLAKDVRQAFQVLTLSRAVHDGNNEGFGLDDLQDAKERILAEFEHLDFQPDQTLELSDIIAGLNQAISLAGNSIDQLTSLERAREPSPPESQTDPGHRSNASEDWLFGLFGLQHTLRNVLQRLGDATPFINGDFHDSYGRRRDGENASVVRSSAQA